MTSLVASALKLAAIAQLTVLTTGFIGALCAYHGIFAVPVLKKMSKLLTKVLLPALALSFFSKYSAEIIQQYAIVFAAATCHLLIGILLGHVAAVVCRIKSPFSQPVALMSGLPHPALPLVMLPAILVNWDAVKDDPGAKSAGLSTIGIYLTTILLIFAIVVNLDIATMGESKAKVLSPKASPLKQLWCALKGVDHTLYCCAGSLVIGVIPPLKEQLMPGGALSWLSGAIAATGSLSPALSVYIIGGLIYNTRMAKLGATTKKVGTKKAVTKHGEASSLGPVQQTPELHVRVDPSPKQRNVELAGQQVQLTEVQLAEYKEAFSMFDADGGGDISTHELGAVMTSLGVEMADDQLAKMVAEADADGGGSIDFNEFCRLMAAQQAAGCPTGGMSRAVQQVQAELDSMEGEGGTKANRAELLRMRWERQRLAASLWTAAYADEDDKVKSREPNVRHTHRLPPIWPNVVQSLGGVGSAPASRPGRAGAVAVNMNKFVALCCVMKLVVMPGACIAFNHALYAVGVIPNNKMMRFILDIYPAIPTAAALVARFSAGGFDDAARYCATSMLPMYLLSIPTIAIFILLSLILIGGDLPVSPAAPPAAPP